MLHWSVWTLSLFRFRFCDLNLQFQLEWEYKRPESTSNPYRLLIEIPELNNPCTLYLDSEASYIMPKVFPLFSISFPILVLPCQWALWRGNHKGCNIQRPKIFFYRGHLFSLIRSARSSHWWPAPAKLEVQKADKWWAASSCVGMIFEDKNNTMKDLSRAKDNDVLASLPCSLLI